MKDLLQKINEASEYITKRSSCSPKIGLILGSGLGILADEISNAVQIDYRTIPNFPVSTVEGHAGKLVLGELEGHHVVAMQGRFHYYEGYGMDAVTFPIRVMQNLGINTLIVTNAAGGVNKEFNPGDLMIIKDHINWSFDNPLIGPNEGELGPRFPDTSQIYDKKIQSIAKQVAQENNIKIQEGVYMMLTGPTYETPAEIRMARFLGADAVGMSTVPEVIVAAHSGMRVLGISCITNMGAGILDQPLNHEEVIDTANRVKHSFSTLVKNTLSKIGRE